MRAGTKLWRNAIVFRITNSGHDRHSVCWHDHEYSVNLLEGALENDAWFAFVAGLDKCDEHRPGGAPVDGCPGCDQWTDEAVWPKANPNIGVSLPLRYLREQVAEAIGKPSAAAVVKRLCFCIWTEGSGKWLDVASFVACADPPDAPPIVLDGRRGYGGLDLSSTTDLTAFALILPRVTCPIEGHEGRCYDLRARFWMPEDNIPLRVRHDHVPYDEWAAEGWITPTPGNVVDQRRVVADVVESRDQLEALGFDRWEARGFVVPELAGSGFRTETEGTGPLLVEIGQGYAGLSAAAKRLEADIAAGLVHHDGNPVMRWMVANAMASQDPAGNIKPDKARSTERIDGVASWCNALAVMATGVTNDEFHSVYEERGLDMVGVA